jgi:hypothetical protein
MAASETVTVACKLPNGLILRNFAMEDADEPVLGGGTRVVKRAKQLPGQVVIKGNAVPFGVVPQHQISSGFALTDGVDKAFWDKWIKDNQDLDAVRNGLIYASPKRDFVEGIARENAKKRSGLEPMNPDKDTRMGPRMKINGVELGVTAAIMGDE